MRAKKSVLKYGFWAENPDFWIEVENVEIEIYYHLRFHGVTDIVWIW